MGRKDLQSLKILVVDDLSEFRHFICSALLLKPEFQVAEASDGLEAVQKASELQPDLIVLDISLPMLDGLEVARRVRNLVPAAKILFCSVESDSDLIREALILGAGYIYKPRLRNDLMPAIEAVFRGEKFVSDLGLNGRTDAPRHEVQFYSNDEVFLDSFARFIAVAIKAGDAAIVVATESHLNGLVPRLRIQGVDVDAAMQQGAYVQLDVGKTLSTFMVNDMPDPARFFEAVGGLIEAAAETAKREHPRVVACGECAPLLWAEGKTDAAIRMERLWDEVGKIYEMDILCGYALNSFHGEEDHHIFQSICAEHTAVYSQ